MNTSPQIRNNRPYPAPGFARRQRRQLRVTILTDGTWFTAHGDKNDESGFDLHFSTDGSNTKLTVHTEEVGVPLPDASSLRIFTNRPA